MSSIKAVVATSPVSGRKQFHFEGNGRWSFIIRSIDDNQWICSVGYEGEPFAYGSSKLPTKAKASRIAKDWIEFEA